MKHTKKELKEMADLTSKLMKKMDGHSVYCCLQVMSAIMANMIVSSIPERSNDSKMNEVFDMIKNSIKTREMLERLLSGKNETMQ